MAGIFDKHIHVTVNFDKIAGARCGGARATREGAIQKIHGSAQSSLEGLSFDGMLVASGGFTIIVVMEHARENAAAKTTVQSVA